MNPAKLLFIFALVLVAAWSIKPAFADEQSAMIANPPSAAKMLALLSQPVPATLVAPGRTQGATNAQQAPRLACVQVPSACSSNSDCSCSRCCSSWRVCQPSC